MTFVPTPLCLHEETVRREWLDYNDHMNVAYYVMAFDHASEAFADYVGMGADYARHSRCSWVVLEAHANFERELCLDDRLRVTTQVLAMDARRVHLFHAMYHAEHGFQAATNELMLMHVDLEVRRAAPFPEDVLERLQRIDAAHDSLDRPPQAGRRISLTSR